MKEKDEQQILKLIDNVKIISIVPSGRSGSYFVQSILDGHENLLNIPFWAGLFDIYEQTSKFMKNKLDIESILDYICNKSLMRDFFNEDGNKEIASKTMSLVKINGKPDYIKIDRKKFEKNFKEVVSIVHKNKKLDERGFYISLYISFAKTLGKKLDKVKYVVDQTHSYKSMKHWYELDPNVKFVHTIRDPRASYYSYIEANKFFNGGSEKSLPDYINNTFSYTFYSLGKIEQYRKEWLKEENYFLIRLEDLHESFEENVKNLARWLEIPIKKVLFESTMGGYPWSSESFTHKRKISGKDPKSNYPKWKEKLTKKQIRNIEFLSSRFMPKQGYEKIYWKKERGVFYVSLSWIMEQIKQINIFGRDYSGRGSYSKIMRELIVGRLKLLYYIIFFKPYKCLE